ISVAFSHAPFAWAKKSAPGGTVRSMPERSRPGDALGVGLGAAARAAGTDRARTVAKARAARGRGRAVIFNSLNRRVGLPFSHGADAFDVSAACARNR